MEIENLVNKQYKKINNIALPLILTNVSSLIIELCDEAMVGRTSLAAFASVGLIGTTINSITGVLGMTSVAFNIIGAKSKGRNDYAGLKNDFSINILISLFCGLLFYILTLLFGDLLLKNIYHLKGNVLDEASIYLNIFSLSLGLNMVLFTFSSYFKIMDKTKYVLYGNAAASISNVIFDYILMFGHLGSPKMGIRGNALGSILALVLNVLIYMAAVRHDKLIQISKIKVLELLKKTLKLSFPLMGQEILESTLIIVAVNSILSHIGILEVSIYNLLLAVVSIASMPMYAYSQASLTIISENAGAGNYDNIKKTPKQCLLLAILFYSALSIIFLLMKNYIPRIITNDYKLIYNSIKYMPLVFLANIFYIPSTIYKYSLQGIEDEKWVLFSSIIINILGLLLIFMLSQIINLKLQGVYVELALNYIILSIVFYYRFEKDINKK
ncbi:MATE family efflux transporter [Haloimpatiens sp. FM7315]|uniref:MATE family efflux transporter n=1 Tax=Haloimpatiens sp. FM7315 TaxID=3298609 RepID=UPI0035A27426